MIASSENEKDYSDYFQVRANTSNILALLSGFTFTGITILLSQFPILGSLTTQFTLFFLAALLFLFMFMLIWGNGAQMRLCRNIPPVTKEIAVFNRLTLVSYILLQLAVVLMFLIWNLVYLSAASGVVWAVFIIATIHGIELRRLSPEGKGKT